MKRTFVVLQACVWPFCHFMMKQGMSPVKIIVGYEIGNSYPTSHALPPPPRVQRPALSENLGAEVCPVSTLSHHFFAILLIPKASAIDLDRSIHVCELEHPPPHHLVPSQNTIQLTPANPSLYKFRAFSKQP